MLRRLILLLGLVVAGVTAGAVPAAAHTELEPSEATAGSTEVLTFRVAFEGAGTTGLDVQLPEGASIVDVPAKGGWESRIDEADRTVSWTGGPVEADEEFEVVVRLPETTGVVLFPAVQKTTDGEVAWISPDEGDGHDGNPAPRITLTADPDATTTSSEPTTTTADLPGTTVEAANEGDGDSAVPWLIGAGIAALVAIALGGWFLKRRMDASTTGEGGEPSSDGDETAT